MPLALALLALTAPAQNNAPPTPAQVEESLLSSFKDDMGDKDAEQSMRKGAHLIATRDLSELVDAMKAAERVMKDAMKDVDPASLKALKDFAANAPR